MCTKIVFFWLVDDCGGADAIFSFVWVFVCSKYIFVFGTVREIDNGSRVRGNDDSNKTQKLF